MASFWGDEPMMSGQWIWIGLWSLALAVAMVAISIFHRRLQASLATAPRLPYLQTAPETLPTVSLIIPAYNESVNITECLDAALASHLPNPDNLQIIVADDESTDDTAVLATTVARTDKRVHVFTVPPRPTDISWRGKNWACANAVEKATGDYVLFIDADVRLEPDAIATALVDCQKHDADLLSCGPGIICGCLAEWLVQPVMMSCIAVGFNFEAVNDPKDMGTAFAAGPFMLFRRSAYDQIGGHQAVATETVEDVELAKRIKGSGLKLRYLLSTDLIKVRMYRSFVSLWEGWTKNYYEGGGRNLGGTLYSAFALSLIFVMPWLGFVVGLSRAVVGDGAGWWLVSGLGGLSIGLQVYMRWAAQRVFNQPFRYWWLGWLSGGIVVAIAITSIIKTETGWGWTWRGRSLATP
ncbi:glycosyl transferase [Leptolyngbya sp. Heron Island J]|uniref:glycosyltransferase n=1 Tax=Leptolyngbya sp. Heron Island J TaxID=1385935 RepID=UPI0003B9C8CE|nr:glycosyltransferase [Leptolyngbya sp. Heron Island J]ESA38347.1 glycosyl transferase [Leptolyngbya sp. Heron Island J]